MNVLYKLKGWAETGTIDLLVKSVICRLVIGRLQTANALSGMVVIFGMVVFIMMLRPKKSVENMELFTSAVISDKFRSTEYHLNLEPDKDPALVADTLKY